MTNSENYAFYIIDNTGNVISWTSAAQEMYGFPAQEIVGKHISFFYTKEYIQKNAFQNLLDKVQKKGRHTVTEWRHTNKGELLKVEDTFTLLNSGKTESGGFLVVTRNVAEEAELKFNEEKDAGKLNEKLRAIAAYRLNLKEEENTAMAKKIHDELGQQITGLKMDVSWLEKKLLQEDEIIKKRVKTIIGMLDDTVKMVRGISADLRPGILDDFGLIDALEWYSSEFEKRTGIKVAFNVEELGINFDKNKTTQLFRIYQESLHGTLDYTGTSIITSNIRVRNQEIEWTIFWDGKEMKKQKDHEKRLLMIMDLQERMHGIGGIYSVMRTPGKGITAYISIPLKNL